MYTALRPVKFGGVAYMIGDPIPTETVNPARVKLLKDAGMIAEVPAGTPEIADAPEIEVTAMVFIPIIEGGKVIEEMELTPEEVTTLVTLLQTPVDPLEAEIKEVTDFKVLYAFDKIDTRKTIKKDLEKRMAELKAGE